LKSLRGAYTETFILLVILISPLPLPLPPGTTGGAGAPGGSDVDLSQLSEEERAIIESVMAKAQELESTAPTNQT